MNDWFQPNMINLLEQGMFKEVGQRGEADDPLSPRATSDCPIQAAMRRH